MIHKSRRTFAAPGARNRTPLRPPEEKRASASHKAHRVPAGQMCPLYPLSVNKGSLVSACSITFFDQQQLMLNEETPIHSRPFATPIFIIQKGSGSGDGCEEGKSVILLFIQSRKNGEGREIRWRAGLIISDYLLPPSRQTSHHLMRRRCGVAKGGARLPNVASRNCDSTSTTNLRQL